MATKAKTEKKPNLFAKAEKKPQPAKESKKGTTFELPKDLDATGALTGSSKVMNEAVSEVIAAKKDEKAATNRANLAKSRLNPWIGAQWIAAWCRGGIQPATPVALANHNGEALTYVVQDRSRSATLESSQVEALENLLGADLAAQIVATSTVFSFDEKTMAEPAGKIRKDASAEDVAAMPTVQDVICEIVSEAISNDPRLTDEQRELLIKADTGIRVRPGVLPQLVSLVGADAVKVGAVLDIIGSSMTRYLKA